VSAEEEAQLRTVIHTALGHPFELKFVYFADQIPRGPNGKFEEVVSRVVTAPL
jgi:phenylacetate-CoA ligase